MESSVNPNFNPSYQTDHHLRKLAKIAAQDAKDAINIPAAVIAAVPGSMRNGSFNDYYAVKAAIKDRSLRCYTTKRGLNGDELPKASSSGGYSFDLLRPEHFLGRFYKKNSKEAVLAALRDLLGYSSIPARAHKPARPSSKATSSNRVGHLASFPNLRLPPTPQSPNDSSVNDDAPLMNARSRMNNRNVTEQVIQNPSSSSSKTSRESDEQGATQLQPGGPGSIGPFSCPLPTRPDHGLAQRVYARLEGSETPDERHSRQEPSFLAMMAQQRFPKPLHFWLQFDDRRYWLDFTYVRSMDDLFAAIKEALGDYLDSESYLSSDLLLDSHHEIFPDGPVFVNRRNHCGLQAILGAISTFVWSKVDELYPSGACQVKLIATLVEKEVE